MKAFQAISLAFFMGLSQWAISQSSGPVAPEAMGFEPVGATDMVNLSTGDFSYVIPLLEVPGPAANYPVALSYHAGVTVEQEASWVGLGWTLTPGAINRAINGTPDDQEHAISSTVKYDDGGTIEVFQLRAGVGLGKMSAGLSHTWGTNKSFGGYVGFQLSKHLNLAATIDNSGSTGISVSASEAGARGSISASGKGFSSLRSGMSFSLSSLGSTLKREGIDYKNTSTIISEYSASYSSNSSVSKMGAYSVVSKSSNFSANIKWFQLSLHTEKTTYWLSLSDHKMNTGILYHAIDYDDPDLPNASAQRPMDIFTIPIDRSNDNAIQLSHHNGSIVLPAYDAYSVSSQGISGSITPRILDDGLLFGRAHMHVGYHDEGISDKRLQVQPKDIFFDFKNTPYSHFRVHHPDGFWGDRNIEEDILLSESSYSLRAIPEYVTSLGGKETVYSTGSLDGQLRMRGGNRIKWFTNDDLDGAQYPAGFIENSNFVKANEVSANPRMDQEYFDKKGIGAFQVTAMDGMVYHYTLPVYQYETVRRVESNKDRDFTHYGNYNKYATAWMLTTITGPDYIDANENHMADEGDYGYWVNFDYGKWSDGFIWNIDADDESDIYSRPYSNYNELNKDKATDYTFGRKQIYYLDAIQTATHTAYFIKSLRKDGYGAKEEDIKALRTKTIMRDGEMPGKLDGTWVKGSSYSVYWPNEYQISPTSIYGTERFVCESRINPIEHRVLRLKKIILVKNEHANLDKINEGDIVLPDDTYGGRFKFFHDILNIGEVEGGGLPEGFSQNDRLVDIHSEYYKSFSRHYQDQVLDIGDFPAGVEAKALKIIEFDHDYSLCNNAPKAETGKLTLKGVQVLGRANASILPPYRFHYASNPIYRKSSEDDWGYDSNPMAWSLNQIDLPYGSSIQVEYEPDSYYTESAYNGIGLGKASFGGYPTSEIPGIRIIKLLASPNIEFDKYIKVGNSIRIFGVRNAQGKFIEVVEQIQSINNAEGSFTIYESNPDHSWDRLYGYVLIEPNNGVEKYEEEGGGLRVKNIKMIDGSDEYITEYKYNMEGQSYTSGVTSYSMKNYKEKEVSHGDVLPGPVVIYSHVEVIENDLHTSHYFKTCPPNPYEYNDLEFNMPETYWVENKQTLLGQPYADGTYSDYMAKPVYSRHATVHNKGSVIGRVEKVETKNQAGDLISSTEYDYYEQTDQLELGIKQESFKSLRNVTGTGYNGYYITLSSHIEYPNILKEKRTIAADGKVTYERSKDHDLFTGTALTIENELPNGEKTIHKSIPAYHIPGYSDMGTEGKNMLTQMAADISYLQRGAETKAVGVNIQTWKNNWDGYVEWDPVAEKFNYDKADVDIGANIWRKHQSYVWEGNVNEDGSFGTDFSPYLEPANLIAQWSSAFGATPADNWLLQSEITRYNHYSAPVEAKDVNGDYAASRNDNADYLVTSTGVNTSYPSYSATSFEESEILNNTAGVGIAKHYGGEILDYTMGSNNPTSTIAHAGERHLLVNPGNRPHFRAEMNNFQKGQKYQAKVWVHENGKANARLRAVVHATSGTQNYESQANEPFSPKGWYLVSLNFMVPEDAQSFEVSLEAVNGAAIFDDFRFAPFSAAINSYTYDEFDQVTAIIGDNGYASKFEYDVAGRLHKVYKETPDGFSLLSENNYNYALPLAVPLDDPEVPIPDKFIPITGTMSAGFVAGLNEVRASIPDITGNDPLSFEWTLGAETKTTTINSVVFDNKPDPGLDYYTVYCKVTTPYTYEEFMANTDPGTPPDPIDPCESIGSQFSFSTVSPVVVNYTEIVDGPLAGKFRIDVILNIMNDGLKSSVNYSFEHNGVLVSGSRCAEASSPAQIVESPYMLTDVTGDITIRLTDSDSEEVQVYNLDQDVGINGLLQKNSPGDYGVLEFEYQVLTPNVSVIGCRWFFDGVEQVGTSKIFTTENIVEPGTYTIECIPYNLNYPSIVEAIQSYTLTTTGHPDFPKGGRLVHETLPGPNLHKFNVFDVSGTNIEYHWIVNNGAPVADITGEFIRTFAAGSIHEIKCEAHNALGSHLVGTYTLDLSMPITGSIASSGNYGDVTFTMNVTSDHNLDPASLSYAWWFNGQVQPDVDNTMVKNFLLPSNNTLMCEVTDANTGNREQFNLNFSSTAHPGYIQSGNVMYVGAGGGQNIQEFRADLNVLNPLVYNTHYQWKKNGSNVGTDQSTLSEYFSPGVRYTVACHVWNDVDPVGIDIDEYIYYQTVPITGSIQRTSIGDYGSVSFAVSLSSAPGHALNYAWYVDNVLQTGYTGQNMTCDITDTQTHAIRLEISNPYASQNETLNLSFTSAGDPNRAPDAYITISPDNGSSGNKNMTVVTRSGSIPIQSYSWEVSGLTVYNSSNQTANCTFPSIPGVSRTYTVNCTITGTNNVSTTISKTVRINGS